MKGLVKVVGMSTLVLSACGGGGGSDPAATSTATPVFLANTGASPTSGACQVFPANAVFNTRIDGFNVHPQDGEWAERIGSTTRLHPDWGSNEDSSTSDYYGIPYNVVDGTSATTAWPLLNLTDYVDESDCAVSNGAGAWQALSACTSSALAGRSAHLPFPLPAAAKHESPDSCADCDRHVLVIEQGACRLWETAQAYYNSGIGAWTAPVAAQWDLNSLAMRTQRWTSADASGMPMTPFIVKAAEANTGEIRHALRMTLGSGVLKDATFVWPASHWSGTGSTGLIPMGAVMRLKSSFVIPSGWTTQARAVAVAMQRYGVYVADRGSNLYVQGEPSSLWQNDTLDQLKTLTMASFEFVDMRAITAQSGFDANSYAATW